MRLFRPSDPRSGQSLDLDLDQVEEESAPVPPRRFPGRFTGVSPIIYRDANGSPLRPDARRALGQAAGSSGQPLPEAIRRKLERALQVDLSQVRIHTGRASQEAAAAVGANAYTVGQDIHFGAGKFQPGTPSGFKLIAHEVAHTVQQGVAGAGELAVSSPGDSVEREAEHIAERVSAAPEPAPHDVASVATAIQPRPGHSPEADDRIGAAHAAVREAEAPGALPMKIAYHGSGMLMRDGDGGDNTPPAGQDPDNSSPAGPTAGSVPDETFDPGTGAGGCDLHGPGCGGGHQLRIVTNFDYVPVVTRGAFEGGSIGHDSIAGTLSTGSSVGRGGGIPGSAFGKATPKFQTKEMNWRVADNTVTVTGQVFVDVRWDVQSRGRVNIDTAEDGYLGPGNYMQAFYDLQDPYPRDMFWVQSLTEQHEQFHVQEYIENTGKEAGKAGEWLASQPIKVPKASSDRSVSDQIDPLVKQIANNVGNAVLATFEAGGEGRAYDAGASAYSTLAQAIKARGDKLHWDKQSGADKSNKGGMVPPEFRPAHRPEEDGQDGWGQDASSAAAPASTSAAAPAGPAGDQAQPQGAGIRVVISTPLSAGPPIAFDAPDYAGLYQQAKARADSGLEAGKVSRDWSEDYDSDPPTLATFKIALTQSLPSWSGYSSAPAEHKAKYDAWAASVKAHEDQHVQIYRTSYAKLTAAVVGPSIAEAQTQSNKVDSDASTDQDTFDASNQPAPLAIPGGTEKIPPDGGSSDGGSSDAGQ